MSNIFATRVFRCAYGDERLNIPLCDQALIIQGQSTDAHADGYGLCLATDRNLVRDDPNRPVYLMPDGCDSGSFVMLNDDGTVTMLAMSDVPDRTIFTTGLCNSNCIMCPYTVRFRQKSKLEPIELLFRCVDLMDPYAEYVCLTGGEPTLLKTGFLSLVAHIRDHFDSAILHILTNGRTFAYTGFANAFRAVRPYKTLLGIPLHADNEGLHDKISQARGSFSETLRGLDNLYSAGERIELRIVTSKLNCENLADLAKFIVNRYPCCSHVCLMGLEMMGNAMVNRSEVWCDYETLWPYVREATEILVSGGVETELYNYPLCYVDHRLQGLYRKSITPSKVEFMPECDTCGRKRECGGFFRTTKVMPGIHVRPFQGVCV